ncbi:cinnamoyl-CoA reductase 1-like [Syzygium oleosum]|uniref:cinnamoyl-CoA reductase 1-like n=1 Tax=Syzygium oleosum TaxID=219896 RepID=UPI0024BAB140|nr:cinnamoyl-CoA reductase 1-like [Syzygium oleosum]
MEEMSKRERICVTGAGGYVASWVVKFLLSKGYKVHGTVRDPSDQKNAHLKELENAQESLHLFATDLLNYEGLCAAITGCTGVLHVASPVPVGKVQNPEAKLMEPAITGTRNVLNACLKANVKKVVVVSSIGAVMVNPNWPKDQVMDERCWTDTERCKSIEHWYCIAKTIAESEALDFAKRTKLNILTVCPSLVIGPMLQSTWNSSSLYLLNFLKESSEPADNGVRAFVDVRDLAEAILLAYKKPKAEGRYICSSYEIHTQDLVQMLKRFYPDYSYPKSFKEAESHLKLSSEKLQNLGWKYRSFEETIVDTVKNYEEKGALCKNIPASIQLGPK